MLAREGEVSMEETYSNIHLDSECGGIHMFHSYQFYDLVRLLPKEKPIKVPVANGQILNAKANRTVNIHGENQFNDILYTPDPEQSLISIRQVTKEGNEVPYVHQ
jgi:hypothetical protein